MVLEAMECQVFVDECQYQLEEQEEHQQKVDVVDQSGSMDSELQVVVLQQSDKKLLKESLMVVKKVIVMDRNDLV